MLVVLTCVLVVSEIRKSIACLIVLRTKQCNNWFLFEPFKCGIAVFFNLPPPALETDTLPLELL